MDVNLHLERDALQLLGEIAYIQGQLDSAHMAFAQVLAITRQQNDRAGEADVLINMGNAARDQGDWSAAQAHSNQAHVVYRAIGNRRGEAMARVQLGWLMRIQGAYADAIADFEQALHMFQMIGDQQGELDMLLHLGWTASEQCAYHTAQHHLAHSLEIARRIGSHTYEAGLLLSLGAVRCILGDYPAAQSYIAQAQPVFQTIASPWDLRNIYTIMGALAHAQSDDLTARAYYEQARVFLMQAPDLLQQAVIQIGLGYVLVRLGLLVEATRSFQDTMHLLSGKGLTRHLAINHAGLAHVLLAQGDIPGALAQANLAVEHLETGTLGTLTTPAMRPYLHCYNVLHAANDPRAQPLLARAYSELMAQAEPLNETDRRMFLENVPWNRAIVKAMQTDRS